MANTHTSQADAGPRLGGAAAAAAVNGSVAALAACHAAFLDAGGYVTDEARAALAALAGRGDPLPTYVKGA